MFSLFLKEVIKLHVDFRPLEIYTLIDKSGKDHFKALEL